MFKALSHVMVWTAAMDRAVIWYKETLGFDEIFVTPHFSLLVHQSSGLKLALHPCEPGSPDLGRGGSPWFLVEDLDAAVAELRAKGAEVEEPKSEGGSPRFANFSDADGNPLGLQEAS